MTTLQNATLNADTTMDAVTLRVGDLENMSSYYSGALALEPLEEKSHGDEVYRVLGRRGAPLIRLIATPDLPVGNPRQAGLFHTAWLFPDAANLAATVYHAARDPRSRFVGSSDHLVSEAFYFTDPEGNGIELYVDRPRGAWRYTAGEVDMDTIRLDPNRYLSEHLTEATVGDTTSLDGEVGHVHLQVGELDRARDFYVGALGFEVTQSRYPGALFASAGGYHHHVAMNIWNSRGAGPRAATLGLGNVAVTVPAREDLDLLVARLRAADLQFSDDGRTVAVRDPWNTQVTVSLPGTTTEGLLLPEHRPLA
ncbi:VOC family protein [Corynebacterium halotolerans]|uniref:Glyoxalase/bleomycin resistance protein/dioxygenase n=1 Tax=Corynebacterium halotolerans YIM 70093 = DSM 44683 TaxID=1121362 RepID=M1P6J7_9CORY|nr:VOC family protein [Corynebacterium halotolerans]AGF72286.1 glyoxalase/bleomycin resistance protein/dioxygenase [Corynebacterium halotolerans YIM 70093 = DSM 44683]